MFGNFHEQPSRSVYTKRLINIGASVALHRQVTDHLSHSDTFNGSFGFFAEFRSIEIYDKRKLRSPKAATIKDVFASKLIAFSISFIYDNF